MPTPGPTHVSALDEPKPQREAVLEAIALEAATGSSISQLAVRFGYTYNGMYKLTQREEFITRRDYFAKRLEDERFTAQKKLLLHLPRMMDAHLAVALPENGPIDSKTAIAAREYLIDKVLPTTTRTENVTQTGTDAGAVEVLTEFRDLLKRISSERSGRTTLDITNSPHVYSGEAALPRPLLTIEATATPVPVEPAVE